MSAAELYRGSFVEPILDALSTAMSIEHRIGVLEDARVGAPPRVTWIPTDKGGVATEIAPFSVSLREVFDLQSASFDVHIWAESRAQLDAIYVDLDAQLDVIIGPRGGMVAIDELSQQARPGYDFGKTASIGPVEDTEGRASSIACVVPATLKAFVSRKDYGTAPIVSVPITVETTDADGGNAETEIAA